MSPPPMGVKLVEIKAVVISATPPSTPARWEEQLLWLNSINGEWRQWVNGAWEIVSAPLIVVPSEVALDTELDARMVAHEALPNIHHPANVGITGTKTIGGFKFTFTNGLLTGFESV